MSASETVITKAVKMRGEAFSPIARAKSSFGCASSVSSSYLTSPPTEPASGVKASWTQLMMGSAGHSSPHGPTTYDGLDG
jgi:hypothetical protein